jgi:hypothetical protein
MNYHSPWTNLIGLITALLYFLPCDGIVLEPAMNRFSCFLRCFAAAPLAAMLVASPSPARILTVPGCETAVQLQDGSWQTRRTRNFGRAGNVESFSQIWRGTVINGVDLGAFLEKNCLRRYRVEPDYPPYLWPPNGSPSWVTPTE